MSKSTSKAHWSGSLIEGSGTVTTASSALHERELTWRARTGEAAGTTPEELIAAAWAGCYSMAFSGAAAKAGHTPRSVDVEASISFGPTSDGGFEIRSGELVVSADVPGIEDDTFQELARGAKDGCPVSVALGRISADAKLEARLTTSA